MSDETKKDQAHYDNLLFYADSAFDRSSDPIMGEHWLGKSEAFEWAAVLFNLHCANKGVSIVTKKSKRKLEEAQHESISYEVKHD